MKVIIFLGPPGSGKGTQARLLSRSLKIPLMGMGDLLRNEINGQTDRGQKIQKAVDSGEMPDWSLVCEIFEEKLQSMKSKRIIFDGIPRNSMQIPDVMNILKHHNSVVEKAIFLNVPESVLVQRIQQRFQCAQCGTSYSIKDGETLMCHICHGSHFVRRNDDQKEVMIRRFRVYQESIAELIGYYKNHNVLMELNGSLPVETIHESIISSINSVDSFPKTEPSRIKTIL